MKGQWKSEVTRGSREKTGTHVPMRRRPVPFMDIDTDSPILRFSGSSLGKTPPPPDRGMLWIYQSRDSDQNTSAHIVPQPQAHHHEVSGFRQASQESAVYVRKKGSPLVFPLKIPSSNGDGTYISCDCCSCSFSPCCAALIS